MENNISELIKALIKFQSEIGAIKKENDNPYFKSKYADLSTFIEAARPALTKNGLVVVQSTGYQDGETVLITHLFHESGQSIESTYPLKPVKADPQAMGSALTYARRYCFSAILGIAAENDDDDANLASHSNGNQQQQQQQQPQPQRQQPRPQNQNQNGAPQKQFKYKVCAMCGAEAYSESKFGNGFHCYKAKGGCGTTFDSEGMIFKKDDDPYQKNFDDAIPAGEIDMVHQLEDEFKTLVKDCPKAKIDELKPLYNEIKISLEQLNLAKAEALMKTWRIKVYNQTGESK